MAKNTLPEILNELDELKESVPLLRDNAKKQIKAKRKQIKLLTREIESRWQEVEELNYKVNIYCDQLKAIKGDLGWKRFGIYRADRYWDSKSIDDFMGLCGELINSTDELVKFENYLGGDYWSTYKNFFEIVTQSGLFFNKNDKIIFIPSKILMSHMMWTGIATVLTGSSYYLLKEGMDRIYTNAENYPLVFGFITGVLGASIGIATLQNISTEVLKDPFSYVINKLENTRHDIINHESIKNNFYS